MGDSELIRALRSEAVKTVRITLEEELDHIPGNGGYKTDYWLRLTSDDGFDTRSYLMMLTTEEDEVGTPIHGYFNLERLSVTGLEARLPVTQQVRLLKSALDKIAEIDPRITGSDEEPVAQISRIGKDQYNLDFMRLFCQYVEQESRNLPAE